MPDIEEIRRALQDRVSTLVAKGSGINRNTISEIKSGKITTARPATLIALAKYLGIDDADS